MKLAVTGGTGFVGSHLIDLAVAEGHQVQALTRREQPARDQVEWVRGHLQDEAALHQLVHGSEAVIHVAGTINAQTQKGFDDGNVGGTQAMLAAATAGGVRRFVQVSSLAAREPRLSLYGASKARAEDLVERSGLAWAIVRPPAVYGPGDKETLELFRMAKLGLVVTPPRGRLSLIHVDDLSRLLLALAAPWAPSALIVEPDDGRTNGWSHRAFGQALGTAIGSKPAIVSASPFLLRLAACVDQTFRGAKAKLTRDRAAYFSHRDWVVDPKLGVPPSLWRPQIATTAGLAQTADWYRVEGWL